MPTKLPDLSAHPVSKVIWVPIGDVEPNDYNPNMVAGREMGLLYTSIKHDGYTQPVVTIYDKARKKYIIVDGFHRYFVCKNPARHPRVNARPSPSGSPAEDHQ